MAEAFKLEDFKPQDDVLKRIVLARREEVVKLQKSQVGHLKDLETRGQARLAALKRTLPKDMLAVLTSQDSVHDEAIVSTKSNIDSVKTKLAKSGPSPENETAVHPGLAGGHLIAPNSLGWFTPYYGTLHGSDGSVYWQGYNPGNIDLSDFANGAGSGIFGTGAASFTVYMDSVASG